MWDERTTGEAAECIEVTNGTGKQIETQEGKSPEEIVHRWKDGVGRGERRVPIDSRPQKHQRELVESCWYETLISCGLDSRNEGLVKISPSLFVPFFCTLSIIVILLLQ